MSAQNSGPRVLHVHRLAQFQGGVEQILHDIAMGLSTLGLPQGLLTLEQGVDTEFTQPFSWSGNSFEEALALFQPDVVLIHKMTDETLLNKLYDHLPCFTYVHDHDLTCPRRHKYFPISGKICQLPAGTACIQHLCFAERGEPENLIPISLFKGIKNQRRLISSSRRSQRFLVGSEWMKASLAGNGINPQAIEVLPPVPQNLMAATPTPLPADPSVLFVGQVIKGKGVDLLLRALAEITIPFTANIVGTGNHIESCKNLSRKLGLMDKVTFNGWIPNNQLENFYDNASLVTVPSRWPEPFGMVGLEAMARGRPVVAFDSGGIADWLEHDSTGYLVETGDFVSFGQRVQHLLSNPALLETMSRNAVSRVQSKYQFSEFTQRFAELLTTNQTQGISVS